MFQFVGSRIEDAQTYQCCFTDCSYWFLLVGCPGYAALLPQQGSVTHLVKYFFSATTLDINSSHYLLWGDSPNTPRHDTTTLTELPTKISRCVFRVWFARHFLVHICGFFKPLTPKFLTLIRENLYSNLPESYLVFGFTNSEHSKTNFPQFLPAQKVSSFSHSASIWYCRNRWTTWASKLSSLLIKIDN